MDRYKLILGMMVMGVGMAKSATPPAYIAALVSAEGEPTQPGSTLIVGVTYRTSGTLAYHPFYLFGGTSGGTLTYTVTSGSIPGMTLNSSTGILSGVPTTAGIYQIGISISSNNGTSASGNFSLPVYATSPYSGIILLSPVNNSGFGNFVAGQPGIATFEFAAGNGNYLASVTSPDTLPAGLILSVNPGPPYGEYGFYLSGTPSTSGYYSFRITATAVSGTTSTQMINLYVSPVQTFYMFLPPIQKASPFSFQFDSNFCAWLATTGPFTFSASSALPTGLTVSSSGLLSGTATSYDPANNLFQIAFTVTGSVGSGNYNSNTSPANFAAVLNSTSTPIRIFSLGPVLIH